MSAHFAKQHGICCPRRPMVGAVVVATVARRHPADVPFWSLFVALPAARAAPDLDQNRAQTVLDLRIGLDGVLRQLPCQRPRCCSPTLPSSSVVYNGFEKLGCGSLAFECNQRRIGVTSIVWARWLEEWSAVFVFSGGASE